jgi:rubrerythrin
MPNYLLNQLLQRLNSLLSFYDDCSKENIVNADYNRLIDESIEVELNIADLYLLFHSLFPQDAKFWWQLVLEEKNHAALIKSIKKTSEQIDGLPNSLFASSLKDLKDINNKIVSTIKKYKLKAPSRAEAFNTAFELEESAGELHYQEFMLEKDSTKMDSIFKELNANDKDHAKRIRSYMERHGITFKSWEPLPFYML